MAGSGFNLDSNQLSPGVYRVVITTNTTNYPIATGNTNGGGVWPYDWNNTAYTNGSTLTAAQALTLAQGNLRWQAILDNLSNIADCRIYDIVVSVASGVNTDATNQPSGVAFTIEFQRDYFILGEWNKVLAYNGATSAGVTFTNADGTTGTAYYSINAGGTTQAITSTALAIQDLVTTGIVRGSTTGYKRTWRVWSPTIGDTQVNVTITQPCVPVTAFGTVAVTQISGTTLAGSPL